MALFQREERTAGDAAGLDGALREALHEIDAAMQEGDAKYGVNAWKRGKLRAGDHVKGVTRHVRHWSMGEKYDADSKRRALAHVAARAILALQCEIDEDERNRHQALTRGNEL